MTYLFFWLLHYLLIPLKLFYQIILANLHVFSIALSPDMEKHISPEIVTFDSGLKRDISKFVLANSITLTPGTVTINEKDGVFVIHCLSKVAAAGVPGDMLKKVQTLFGETPS